MAVLLAVAGSAGATSWGPPGPAGVAAVETRTGKVVWEAWRPDEVPAGTAKDVADAVKELTSSPRGYQHENGSGWPVALAPGRFPSFRADNETADIILSASRLRFEEAEVARATFDAKKEWEVAAAAGVLYVLSGTELHAFTGGHRDPTDQTWRQEWTLDLSARVSGPPRSVHPTPWTGLAAMPNGVWVSFGPRLFFVDKSGRPTAEAEVMTLWPNETFFGFQTRVSAGKRLVYFHQSKGLVAFDPETNREAWRLETHRFPYPSRVVETADGLTLVQIGSDAPNTIAAALGLERYALPKLGRDSPQRRAAAAELLHAYGDGLQRPLLRQFADDLRRTPAPRLGSPAATLDHLQATWPAVRDRQRLLDAVVAVILGRAEPGPFGNFVPPAVRRIVAWCQLQELIYRATPDGYDRLGVNFAYHDGWVEQPVVLPADVSASLVDECRRVVEKGPDAEKPFAASVLVSRAVGWDRLPDAERKNLLLSDNPAVWRWAAVSLAKTGCREQLVLWGADRPASDRVDLLWILKHDMPKDWPDAELNLWLACADRTPGPVAYMLGSLRRGDGFVIPAAFRPKVRKYLEQEIAKPTVLDVGTQAAGDLLSALEVLHHWNNPEDNPLLLQYLKHPCCVKSSHFTGDQLQKTTLDYRIREYVAGWLKQRGVKVPDGVVYSEVAEPKAR